MTATILATLERRHLPASPATQAYNEPHSFTTFFVQYRLTGSYNPCLQSTNALPASAIRAMLVAVNHCAELGEVSFLFLRRHSHWPPRPAPRSRGHSEACCSLLRLEVVKWLSEN